MGNNVETKTIEQMREEMIADLRGGSEGLERWRHHRGTEKMMVAHLRDANLSGVDLSGATLFSTRLKDFRSATFEGSTMSGVFLGACDVSDCNFRNALLDDASFKEANARGADFSGASLKKVSFEGAVLSQANFSGADLAGIDLRMAALQGANFANTDLSGVVFLDNYFDERTIWPTGFVPPHKQLIYDGLSNDPFLVEKVNAMAVGGKVDLGTLVHCLDSTFDQQRFQKALTMLKKDKFQLFAEVSPQTVIGVVKSQRDPDLFYACRLDNTGSFACCTQNLKLCGGLRGALCKHLMVLIVGLTKSGEIDAMDSCVWTLASARNNWKYKQLNLDKEEMANIFIRYKAAAAGEMDWRPTETMPEDYYAF